MTIRKILSGALRRIGREEIADDIDDEGEPWGENGEVVKTLLYCINAVEDELARYYFPLTHTEAISSENGFFAFSSFAYTPIKILGVKSGGRETDYKLLKDGLSAQGGEIEVTYNYVPYPKTMEDSSDFGDIFDGEITVLGAAAEYCLICGEAALAEVWETRYRESIDRARRINGRGAHLPPRRWV